MNLLLLLPPLILGLCYAKILLVYRHREKEINIIFSRDDWSELTKPHLEGKNSFPRLFINPFKWTYKQMYGDL